MSSNQDQARLIAERVARRLSREPNAGERGTPASANGSDSSPENHRARIVNFVSSSAPTRTESSIGSARAVRPDVQTESFEPSSEAAETFFHPQVAQSPWLAPFSRSFSEPPPQGNHPRLAIQDSQLPNHPSQERFGVDEAVVSELVEFFEAEKQCSVDLVSELVEFFEAEKQCSVDPSGKPCDHCAMCSSRGF